MVPVQAKQGQPLKVYATELKEVFKGRHWAGPYISAASFEDTELMMCDSPYKVLGELGDTSGVVKTDFVAPPPIKQHG